MNVQLWNIRRHNHVSLLSFYDENENSWRDKAKSKGAFLHSKKKSQTFFVGLFLSSSSADFHCNVTIKECLLFPFKNAVVCSRMTQMLRQNPQKMFYSPIRFLYLICSIPFLSKKKNKNLISKSKSKSNKKKEKCVEWINVTRHSIIIGGFRSVTSSSSRKRGRCIRCR